MIDRASDTAVDPARRVWRLLRGGAMEATRRGGIEWDRLAAQFRQSDISIFHEFAPPPAGGGHQFLRALRKDWESRGLRLENNTISRTTRSCLFNSQNFDFDRLRRLRRSGCRMVHRVDGPIDFYRGCVDGIDRKICQINRDLADATIFQSHFSMNKHLELGMEFVSPAVVINAVDTEIFHPSKQASDRSHRKIRLISGSWSVHPNKGAVDYEIIEKNLDWNRFDYTFVGRAPVPLKQIKMLAPVPTRELSDLLRAHDIYIFTSRIEACSNSLLEALACGLPVIYKRSGSNPEIVGEAGLGYDDPGEIPALLERIVAEYARFQSLIRIPTLGEVARRYLEVMGIERA